MTSGANRSAVKVTSVFGDAVLKLLSSTVSYNGESIEMHYKL